METVVAWKWPSGDTIRTLGALTGIVGALAGIVGALVGAIWFFATLEGRVRQLEAQVHTLTVAPVIAASGSGAPGSDSSKGSGTVPNPIAQACADLAGQAVAHASLHNTSAQMEAETMMKTLGCSPAQR
jgi:hypothetical protein